MKGALGGISAFHRRSLAYAWASLLAALGAWLLLTACQAPEEGLELRWTLPDSLSRYDRVVITLHPEGDTATLLKTLYDGRIDDPESFPPTRYAGSPDNDYQIIVRGYNAKDELALESFIRLSGSEVVGVNRTPPDQLPGNQGLLLRQLSTSVGEVDLQTSRFEYSLETNFENDTAWINALPADTQAIVILEPSGDSMSAGEFKRLALQPGQNDIQVRVALPHGALSYSLTIQRDPGTNADLKSLEVIGALLSPEFSPADSLYSITLDPAQATASIEAIAALAPAVLKLGNDSALGRIRFNVSLAMGDSSTQKIHIQSPDGSRKRTLTLKFFRPLSSSSALDSLTVPNGRIYPSFNANFLAYKATVPAGQTHIRAVASGPGATLELEVGGIPETLVSGQPSTPFVLHVGATDTCLISVTSADKSSRTLYSLILTGASPEAQLDTLEVWPKLLSSFRSDSFSYAGAYPRTQDTALFRLVTADPKAKVSGIQYFPDGDSTLLTPLPGMVQENLTGYHTSLKVGLNRFLFTVTAEDQVSKNFYSVEALRTPRNVAVLDSLALKGGSNGVWSPAYAPTTAFDYQWLPPFPFDSVTARFNIYAKDSLSRVLVHRVVPNVFTGKAVSNSTPLPKAGAEDPVILLDATPPVMEILELIDTLPHRSSFQTDLITGQNVFQLRVIAEDTAIAQNYRFKVERALSDVAKLTEMTAAVPSGTGAFSGLAPPFHPDSLTYRVQTSAASFVLTAETEASGSKLAIDSTDIPSGSGSLTVPVSTTERLIYVVVTSPSGRVNRPYKIYATRILPVVEPPILIGPPIQTETAAP